MFQPFELFVGLRYTRAKRRNHFISFISLISIVGIMLGVTALITVTSVMNGFEEEMTARIVGASSHATVTALGEPLTDWEPLAELAAENDEVIGAAPYGEGQAMLVHAGRSTGALIRGVLPDVEGAVSELGENLEDVDSLDAALAPGEFGVLLGADLAAFLGAVRGDRIMLITPEASVTPLGFTPRVKRFLVTGVFRFGMYQFDRNLAVVHAADAAALFRLGEGGFSGLRLKLEDTGARAAGRARAARRARLRLVRQRLDTAERQLLRRREDGEDDDVHHPLDDRRCRRVQHRLHPRHAGAGQAG